MSRWDYEQKPRVFGRVVFVLIVCLKMWVLQ